MIETRCCGEKTISIERLKSITTYPHCDKDHRIIDRFWRVFERFTEEEKALYLKFVWGRSRLPVSLDNLAYRHEVRLMESANNRGCPIAHTCFFQLDIPDYDDDEICYSRLLSAITMCGGIELDDYARQNDSD